VDAGQGAAGCSGGGNLPSRTLGVKVLMVSHPRHFLLGGLRRDRDLSPAPAGLPLPEAEKAPAKGLTHRGLPASQTRRLIVSGSGPPAERHFRQAVL
jgi:hypothetical protein